MTCPPFEMPALRGRILVVEEPSVFREMQSLLLRGAGYDVANCDDLIGALVTLARQEFNLMLLNTEQPAAHDPEFLVSVRRNRPQLTLMVAAEAVTADLSRQLARLGVATVLQRPVNPHTLALRIDEVLGTSLCPAAPMRHEALPSPGTREFQRDADCRPSLDDDQMSWPRVQI